MQWNKGLDVTIKVRLPRKTPQLLLRKAGEVNIAYVTVKRH